MLAAVLGTGSYWQMARQLEDKQTYDLCVLDAAHQVFDKHHPLELYVATVVASLEAGVAAPSPSYADMPPEEKAETDRLVAATCRRPSTAWFGAYSLVVIAGLAALAAAGYWTLPQWRIRRRRLVGASRAGLPEDLLRELDGLSQAAGVRVRYHVHPTDDRVEGVAFGRVGRRRVELKSGLLAAARTDRPAFRAIVEHELAHIRNRDLDASYLTLALWRPFVLLALVVVLGYRDDLQGAAYFGKTPGLVAYVVMLVLLVYLARNSVLRNREYHADAYAARHEPGRAALIRLLSVESEAEQWSRLAGTHPSRRHRRRVLEGAVPIPELGPGDAFVLGMLFALALPLLPGQGSRFYFEWSYRLHWTDQLVVRPFFPALELPVLLPVGAALAVGAWRAVRELSVRDTVRWALQAGTALGAGLLVGDWAVPSGPAIDMVPLHDLSGPGTAPPTGRATVFLAGLTTVLALAAAAAVWRRARLTERFGLGGAAFAAYGAAWAVVWFPDALGKNLHTLQDATGRFLLFFPVAGLIAALVRGVRKHPGMQ